MIRRLPVWWPSPVRVVQGLVGLGVAAALLIWGLPHFVGTTWPEVFDRLGQVGPGTALQLLILMLCGLWFYTFTLTGSLPGLSHPRALILNVCGSSVGNLLPGGGAAGVAATYGMCRSWGFTRRDISASVIVSGIWNVLGRLALPVIGTGVLLTDASSLPRAVVRGATIGAVAGLALLILSIAVIVSQRAAAKVGRGLDKVLRPWWRKPRAARETNFHELVLDLRVRLNTVIRTGWVSMTLGLCGFFGVYYLLFWFCLAAVGVQVTFAHMFAAYAVGRLLSTVGITPGGLGITETGTAAVLIGFGADPAAATSGVVLFSIYIHLLEIPLGALGWIAWGLSPKHVPVEAFDPGRDLVESSPDTEGLSPNPGLRAATGKAPPPAVASATD